MLLWVDENISLYLSLNQLFLISLLTFSNSILTDNYIDRDKWNNFGFDNFVKYRQSNLQRSIVKENILRDR